MFRSRIAALVLALSVLTPTGTNAQGIGGLIKKKAAEAIKGPEKTAAKPDQASATQDKCAITDDAIARFLKGLEAERADRAVFKAHLGTIKPKKDWEACKSQVPLTPEGQKAAEPMMNMPQNSTREAVQKIIEKVNADMEKVMIAKCGPEPEDWSNSKRSDRLRESEKVGAKAAGMDEDCYHLLKERAIPFCSLSQAQQQQAMANGIKVPGATKTMYYVYTPVEAKALAPRCADIMAALKAIDSIVILEKGGA